MATNNDSKLLINPTRNDCPDTEKVKFYKVVLFPFPILRFIPGFDFLKLTMNELFSERDSFFHTQCRLCDNNKPGAKLRVLSEIEIKKVGCLIAWLYNAYSRGVIFNISFIRDLGETRISC